MIIASSIGRLAGLSPLIPKNCVGLIMNSDKRTARGGNEERGSGHGGQDPKIPSTAETKADPVSAGENKALCVEALSKSGFQCHFVTDTERSAMDEICAHVVGVANDTCCGRRILPSAGSSQRGSHAKRIGCLFGGTGSRR